MSIGKNIQTLRKENKMSQDQLAQKCNVSRQTISRWECDEVLPDTNNLITLSKLFNKSLDELVFDSKKKETKNNKWKIIGLISLVINCVCILSILITSIQQKENEPSISGTYELYVESGKEKIV